MIMEWDDLRFLRRAIAIAQRARDHGNHPFGALLVDVHQQVLFEAENTVVTEQDCTGHAETNLMRLVSRQLPLEVRSEAPADVSRFFEGRVPFHLTLPDYPVGPGETKPYRLVGGRLVAFDGDYAAYVAYHMDERPISLLVTAAERVRPEGGETLVSGGLTFHIESVAGLKVITWTDKGLTYALASDLAVAGNRSCMVCHGSAEERRKLEGL
jgi:hypothetical protein